MIKQNKTTLVLSTCVQFQHVSQVFLDFLKRVPAVLWMQLQFTYNLFTKIQQREISSVHFCSVWGNSLYYWSGGRLHSAWLKSFRTESFGTASSDLVTSPPKKKTQQAENMILSNLQSKLCAADFIIHICVICLNIFFLKSKILQLHML